MRKVPSTTGQLFSSKGFAGELHGEHGKIHMLDYDFISFLTAQKAQTNRKILHTIQLSLLHMVAESADQAIEFCFTLKRERYIVHQE